MTTDKLYTLRDAAKLLSVHPVTIQRWAKAGKVDLVTLPGGDMRISGSELARITDGKVNPSPIDWNEPQESPI